MKHSYILILGIFILAIHTLAGLAADNPITPEGYFIANILFLILLQIPNESK
jgi:hypothetical protein